MQSPYNEDLAYIHDSGFSLIAEHAAPLVLDALKEAGFTDGVVVDLGCGSGITSRAFRDAGFDVVGIDLSAPLLEMARRRVPDGDLRLASYVSADLPPCVAVTAIGEVFNYGFDAANGTASRLRVFERIREALAPGGILVFDMAGCARMPEGGHSKTFHEGPDWTVTVAVEGDGRVLTRRITTFRRQGECYRRDHEVHTLHLIDSPAVVDTLRRAGFTVRTMDRYGDLELPRGLVAFLATRHGL